MVNRLPRLPAPLSAAVLAAARNGVPVTDAASGTRRVSEEYTRFERARILGARALQVSLGAPILIDVPTELIDPVEIAEREFEAGVIPITVRRGGPAR
jgi:DNA-directed RNA polymerase subunit K